MDRDYRSMRVLVVEDSPTQAQQLRMILTSAGFEVEVAYDGQAGWDRFVANDYHLILSDVVMPGLNGYELCQKIKRDKKGQDIPVVLLTALNELKDLIEGLRSGADNFLTKPYEPSFLIQRVKNILAQEKDTPTQSVCDPESGVCFIDKRFIMQLDRKKILDYLVSTFDDFLRTRQRESEHKLSEAKRRLELIEERERLFDALARDLRAPLEDGAQTLEALLSGRYGQLGARQSDAMSVLAANLRRNLQKLDRLLTQHGYKERIKTPYPPPSPGVEAGGRAS